MKQMTKLAIGTVGLLTMLGLAVAAFPSGSHRTAFSNVSLVTATIPAYDFGDPVGVQPAIIQIQTFKVHPGAAFPWHYHKAVSYVAIERGTIAEQHLNADGTTCSLPQELTAGEGTIEQPFSPHTVVNVGKGNVLITWTTVYPATDPPLRVSPSFTIGGVYPVAPPNCNN